MGTWVGSTLHSCEVAFPAIHVKIMRCQKIFHSILRCQDLRRSKWKACGWFRLARCIPNYYLPRILWLIEYSLRSDSSVSIRHNLQYVWTRILNPKMETNLLCAEPEGDTAFIPNPKEKQVALSPGPSGTCPYVYQLLLWGGLNEYHRNEIRRDQNAISQTDGTWWGFRFVCAFLLSIISHDASYVYTMMYHQI